MTMKKFCVILVALVCGSSLLFRESLATSQPRWTPYMGMPPFELASQASDNARLDDASGTWSGNLYTLMTDRSIGVSWRDNNSGKWHRQKPLALSYWPTAIVQLPSQFGFCVAGKRDNGNTVIEHVVLAAPSLQGTMFLPATIARITTVFDRAISGLDIVAALDIPSDGSDRLLVSYYDSHNLYSVDLTDPAYGQQLLASPTVSQAGVLLIPELAEPNTLIKRATHLTLGHTYHLSDGRTPNSVLIYDSNQDGVFDGHVSIIDSADWHANGFDKSVNFSAILD